MHKQISEYVNQFLSPYLCGYRQSFSTQQALVYLIKKWKAILDKNGYPKAVLMDLSKAFDTIIITLNSKTECLWFHEKFIKADKKFSFSSQAKNKNQHKFSSWMELVLDVPQGSVLGTLLFNIYISDLIFLTESTNVCNYADDTTFHACDIDLEKRVRRLEHGSMLAIDWFKSNYKKLNQDKSHFLLSRLKHETIWVNVGQTKIC